MSKSISRYVREIVNEMPFLIETMRISIINYNSLAEYLKPKVDAEFQYDVKILAISMALRRYAKEISVMEPMNLDIDSSTEITSKSNLIEFIIVKSPSIYQKINKIYETIGDASTDILTVMFGTTNVTIITNSKYSKQISLILNVEKMVSVRDYLGAIYLSMSSDYRERPGYIFTLSKELAFNGVNILTMSNIDTEVVFLFDGEDVPKAFQILYELINRKI